MGDVFWKVKRKEFRKKNPKYGSGDNPSEFCNGSSRSIKIQQYRPRGCRTCQDDSYFMECPLHCTPMISSKELLSVTELCFPSLSLHTSAKRRGHCTCTFRIDCRSYSKENRLRVEYVNIFWGEVKNGKDNSTKLICFKHLPQSRIYEREWEDGASASLMCQFSV